MKFEKVITVDGLDSEIQYYHGDWHISGELENFLEDWSNKKVKITIEVLEDDEEEFEARKN